MSAIEFKGFNKIARFNRSITITEKLDGTNAAVVIVPVEGSGIETVNEGPVDETHIRFVWDREDPIDPPVIGRVGGFYVFAQSRTRFITPGNDNYGFARWVAANAEALVETLGEGTHYGEWWGSGIQRNRYGLTGNDKRFSLFNTARWWGNCEGVSAETFAPVPGLGVVPVLYDGPFDQLEIDLVLQHLRGRGSFAAPGFMNPEGIVIYHTAARSMFKITLEGDEAPKGAAGHANDVEKVAA